jgi:hypothetical protein
MSKFLPPSTNDHHPPEHCASLMSIPLMALSLRPEPKPI